MSNFPPSLSKVPPHKPTDRHMARYERQVEKDKKRRERLDAVEAAMKSLPLKTGAESEIPKMKGLFEQAFHAAANKPDAATTRMMEDELNALAKALKKSAELVNSLHPDTLKIWAAGADPAANGAALLLVLREGEGWTEDSIGTLKRGKRIGGPGRAEDLKAKWMKQTAAFIYEKVTIRKAHSL